jgi:23S rRNA G2445 N2-methylase RlmL
MAVTLLARCVRGLEWVAADEVSALAPGTVTISPRSIDFTLPDLVPELLGLRTVDDVFLRLGEVSGVGTTKDVVPGLAQRLARLSWAAGVARLRELRVLPERPAFDVVASIDGKRNFNRYAVENALGPRLASVLGGSYLARTGEGLAGGDPDLTVRVFLDGTRAIGALRLGARPAHRRGYKLDTGAGTLHPPVAAALVRLTAPAAGESLLDPFCGDGTIAIEAALAFPDARVAGSDLDPARLANAKANAARAGVEIGWNRADAGGSAATADLVVTNPPWNLAVDARGTLSRSLEPFWRSLRERVSGRICLLADAELAAGTVLRGAGFPIALGIQIRLAGRVSEIVLCAPPGRSRPALPPGPAIWRARAEEAGVVTAQGF